MFVIYFDVRDSYQTSVHEKTVKLNDYVVWFQVTADPTNVSPHSPDVIYIRLRGNVYPPLMLHNNNNELSIVIIAEL